MVKFTPLGGNVSLLDDVDLQFFFSYATSEKVNFFRINLKDFVEKIKALQKEQANA